MNIYVSNLPYTATDENLREAFAALGNVTSARIIRDRITSRSRGFGFVEMDNEEEGKKAVETVNGTEMLGRRVNAREARPREEGGERGPQGERSQGGEGGGERSGQPPVERGNPRFPKEHRTANVQNRGMY
jgi:RNA recognition motif-containing protein